MDKFKKTTSAKSGGLFVGKSHDNGGMPAIVVDTGQPIEVEGGEVIINKVASKKYWKELSKINQSAGNGVAIPPPMEFSKDVSAFKSGGKISMSAIRQGTEIELEHASTIESFKKQGVSVKEIAQKIAKDHLKENPNYYKILTKLKLAKGGEVVCRSCGNSWLKHHKDVGMNVFECDSCGNQNSNFYKKGGQTESLSLPEKEKIYVQWKDLINMSKSELQKFYNSVEGKEAGLTDSKAKELGVDNGRTSARWIIKMKDVPFVNWTDEMWRWAKKQINFIKRMSGNKGALYNEKGVKTRKHTSLLIWGHNPEKFKTGGQTQAQQNKIGVVMHEFKEGKLYSSSGKKIVNPKQAIAIALSKSKASKYAKGNRISKTNKGGDCYEVAGKIAIDRQLPNNQKFNGTPYVVHAEVSGQGAISGIRYGHAWVEDDLNVYDFSNGRAIVFPKQPYYKIGNVKTDKPKYYKYTFDQAIEKMLEMVHYGSWDLQTESGL